MADIMVDSVTTGIDLNETKAVEAINRLKSAVKDSTREWQINEAQAKSAGDAVSASKYRYEGLSEAMEKQKAYIANLSEGMKTINRDTDAGEKAYQKYNAQLTTAERSLASMTGQLNRAKSAYEYQQTGIEDLNKSLSANDKLMQSQIDLYEKTRNKMGAAKAEVSGLSTSYAKQTEIYRAQVTELKRLEAAEGTSSEALVKQKTRVNEAGSALLTYRNKLLEANLALTKIQPFNPDNIVGKSLNTVYQTTEKATTAMAAGYQKVKNAAYQSAFGIAAIGAAAIKGSQMAADLQESYIRTTNLAVTGGEEVAEVTKNVAQMQKDGAQYSVEYGKSQKEIAEGYQELIKRGYTSTEALGAMRSELQASVASGDEFNNVLSVTSQVVDAYGMRTDNAAQMTKNTKDVVNQLAYAADMTATDFASMGKAMEYVGDSAHSAGFQLSEASSAIGILSNHGLEADKAGTGLRKVINSITGALSDQSASQEDAAKSEAALNEKIAEHQKKLEEAQAVVNSGTGNTKAATKAIEKQKEAIGKLQDKVDQLQSGGAAKDMLSKLGIKNSDLVDANGNLRDLTTIMSVVNEHTKNMGTAEKNSVFQQLFGTTGQQAGIILAQNNKELEELNTKVRKSADGQGYVANLANKNMASVKAEMEQFKAAGEAVLIMIGQKFLPVMSDAATSMAKAFNSKEGKQGLEEIAGWIAKIFQGIVDTVKFIGTHKDEVVTFGKIFAGIWATKKIVDVIVWLEKLKKSLLEIQAIDALSGGLGTGGIKTSVGKGVVSEAGTVASTVTKGGVAAEGEAVAASGGLSKILSFLPRLMNLAPILSGLGIASNVGGELLSKDSNVHKGDVVGGTLGGAAAGAAIGSIIPGVGTLIGASLGGLAGSTYGKKLGDTVREMIKDAKDKSEKLPIIDFDVNAPTKDMKGFSKDYQGFLDKIKKSATIDIVDEKSLEKAKKETADAYAKMSKDIDKFYQNQEKDSKKQVDILVKNGVLSQAQADKLNKGQKDSDDKQKAAQKKNLDEIVKNAQKQRDDTISAAKKQQTEVTDKAQKTHDKTVELANDKADKNVKAAAKEQGETVEQYTKGFRDSRSLINSFIDGINGVLNFLHKGWGNIGHVSLKGFATGTRGLAQDETALVGEEGFELAHHPNRGIFAVGQQGPEIRNLKAGTSILPHSMSKEFLSLTANLPAHADGVSGFLSDALGWVKSTYKDVTSVISKGPKGVVEAIYNGLGLDNLENDFPPVVTRMAKGSAQTAQDNFVKFLQSFFKKAESDAGGSQGSPSGSGVQRWAGQVKQALAANGLSTSQDMIDRVLRQIATESSGNEKAVQGNIGDINNITGDLAKGLMQTISATFNAYKFPGHSDIFNGYDNLLAALNYAKSRYGSSLSFLGNGHGYENGGIINAHGFYEIAEGNRPEMVIPLDPQKKSRATQLLNQASQTINNNSDNQNNANDISSILFQTVGLLSQILGVNQQQLYAFSNMPAPIVDERSLSNGLAPEMNRAIDAYKKKRDFLRGE